MVPLPRAGVAVAVLQQCFNHFHDPERAVSRVGAALRSARGWRLSYDDPVEAALLLRDELTLSPG